MGNVRGHSRGELHFAVCVLEPLLDGDVLVFPLVRFRFLLVDVSLLQIREALESLVQLLLLRETLASDCCKKKQEYTRVALKQCAHVTNSNFHDNEATERRKTPSASINLLMNTFASSNFTGTSSAHASDGCDRPRICALNNFLLLNCASEMRHNNERVAAARTCRRRESLRCAGVLWETVAIGG